MLKITLSPKAIAPLLIVFMLFGIAGSLHAYYDWPLAPMNGQHHVFSTFDEFRSPSAACPVDHFHDGVDIHGYTGNEVLAVMGGTVQFMDEVNGLYINGSYVIGYAHVNHPDLLNGQSVNYGDPIGTIDGENHLHFMEGPDKDEVNPLSVWGLSPFTDDLDPTIMEVKFYDADTHLEVDPMSIEDDVDIVVKAKDSITGGGTNAGLYGVGFQVIDAGVVIVDRIAHEFDYWFDHEDLDNYVDCVYGEGSNTSTFKYIATNGSDYDYCWDDRLSEYELYDVDNSGDGLFTIRVWAWDIVWGQTPYDVPVRFIGMGVGDPVDLTVKNHFPNGSSGGTVMVSGVTYDSPLEYVMYEGDDITISAISPQNYGPLGKAWFTNWSDGGDQTHVVSPLAPDAEYTAYFTFRRPPDPKGRIWDGNGFVEDNTILSPTWRREPQALDVADYCLLNEHLAEQDGQYLIQIVQDDGEPSYFDRVELLLVEHPEDVLVGLHPEGEMIAYTRMTSPTSCVDKDGNDRLELMKEVDSQYFQGRKDDWLAIEFEETESTDLVLEAVVAGLGKEPIALQVQSEGGWEDIASIHGRANWSTEVTDISSVVASRTERTKLRLLWLADHELDYVGLGLPRSSDLSVRECPLASAIHPRMGEVTKDLLAADQRRIELISGDEVELAFSSLALRDGYQRDFILVSTGHRKTGDGDDLLPQSVADHPIPTSFSLSQNYPNPFDSRTEIGYSLPKDGHVTLKIYNAQWQLVRNLVSTDKEAGYYKISWDGKNDNGEDVASGQYFCQTKAGGFAKSMSMVLLR